MQRFITCRFLDVANTMLEITDFCPKLRFFSILITDFNFQRLAALHKAHDLGFYLFLFFPKANFMNDIKIITLNIVFIIIGFVVINY